MSQPFKGLHIVSKALASGEKRKYYYAWRGGPRLFSTYGTPEFAREFALAHSKQAASPSAVTLSDGIKLYRQSQAFGGLAASTKKEYERCISVIEKQFGRMPLKHMDRSETRALVYKFRDKFTSTARKADYLVSVLSAILAHLVDQSKLERNVAAGIKKIYKSNRANIIWNEDEIEAVCGEASEELGWTIRFAALTGMRTGDLIAVPWSAVHLQDRCIDWRTSKNKVDVYLPITDELALLLEEMPQVAETVITNTAGKAWTKDGLKTMFGRAKAKAGISEKHFHDLRGTAATRLCLAGLDDRQVASIIGWSPTRVADIRKRYVDKNAIVQDVISKLRAASLEQKTVNRGVNQRSDQRGGDS